MRKIDVQVRVDGRGNGVSHNSSNHYEKNICCRALMDGCAPRFCKSHIGAEEKETQNAKINV
jgi:hypothetical protein